MFEMLTESKLVNLFLTSSSLSFENSTAVSIRLSDNRKLVIVMKQAFRKNLPKEMCCKN